MDDHSSPHWPPGNPDANRHTSTQQHRAAPRPSQQSLAQTTSVQPGFGHGQQAQQTEPYGQPTAGVFAPPPSLLQQENELQRQQLELKQQRIAEMELRNEPQSRQIAALEQQLSFLRKNQQSSTALMPSSASSMSQTRQISQTLATQLNRPVPANSDRPYSSVDKKRKHSHQFTAPAEEDDVVPAVNDNGYASVNLPISDQYPNTNSRESNTRKGRSGAPAVTPPPSLPIKRRPKKQDASKSVPPLGRFIFVPEQGLKPLNALPGELFQRFSTWLDNLFTDKKYVDRACKKLSHDNQTEVIESGQCIARHIIWKTKTEPTTKTDLACKTCCDAAEPRPCVKLVRDEADVPVLVFFPRPADRRPSGVTWTSAQYWLGIQGRI